MTIGCQTDTGELGRSPKPRPPSIPSADVMQRQVDAFLALWPLTSRTRGLSGVLSLGCLTAELRKSMEKQEEDV